MDHSGPTVKMRKCEGGYGEVSQGAHFAETIAAEQEVGLVVSRAGGNKDCGLSMTEEQVDDRGVPVVDSNTGNDRVSVHQTVTPSVGYSTEHLVVPPEPAALPRPVNQKPASSR